MKKTTSLLVITLFLGITLLQAQEEKASKFSIIGYGSIGYGIVQNDKASNYNLHSNSGDLLLNYKINSKFGIASGIGVTDLSGNGFNDIGHFFHERSLLKIPLVATINHDVTDKISVIVNVGVYTQNITKDDYRFQNNTTLTDVYNGWNFGTQLGIGFVMELFENFSAGVNYLGQSDFSKFETTNNQTINDKQKIKNLNSVGVLFLIDL